MEINETITKVDLVGGLYTEVDELALAMFSDEGRQAQWP